MMLGSDLSMATNESVERTVRETRGNFECLKQRAGESIEKYAKRSNQVVASYNSAIGELLKVRVAQHAHDLAETSGDGLDLDEVEQHLRGDNTYDPIRPEEAAERYINGLSKDPDFWGRDLHKVLAVVDLLKQRDSGHHPMSVTVYRLTFLMSIDAVVGRLNQLFEEHLNTPDTATWLAQHLKKNAAGDGLGIFAAGKKQVDESKSGATTAKDAGADGSGAKAGGGGKTGGGGKDGGGKAGGGKTHGTCNACHKPGHRWADGACPQGIAWAEKNAARAAAKANPKA
jgi:hypothetical protein